MWGMQEVPCCYLLLVSPQPTAAGTFSLVIRSYFWRKHCLFLGLVDNNGCCYYILTEKRQCEYCAKIEVGIHLSEHCIDSANARPNFAVVILLSPALHSGKSFKRWRCPSVCLSRPPSTIKLHSADGTTVAWCNHRPIVLGSGNWVYRLDLSGRYTC